MYKDGNGVGPALILRLRQNQAPDPTRARITNLLSRRGRIQHRALAAMDSRRAPSVGSGGPDKGPRGHGQVGACSHAGAGDGQGRETAEDSDSRRAGPAARIHRRAASTTASTTTGQAPPPPGASGYVSVHHEGLRDDKYESVTRTLPQQPLT